MFESSQVKHNEVSVTNTFLHKLHQEFLDDFRSTIIGNHKILQNFQED